MTPMLATDLHAVHALILRAFAGMEGRIDPPSSARDLTVASLAAAGEVWTLPHACVILTPKGDHLYIGKLAVDPGHQRQGSWPMPRPAPARLACLNSACKPGWS